MRIISLIALFSCHYILAGIKKAVYQMTHRFLYDSITDKEKHYTLNAVPSLN